MNLKKIFLPLAALIPASLSIAATIVSNGLTFETSAAGECTLTSGLGASGRVVIPAKVSHNNADYRVTAIAADAFLGNLDITGVYIPATIKRIGNDAFRRCQYLHAVEAESLTGWLDIVFDSETASPLYNYATLSIAGSLLEELNVGTPATEVRDYAFYNCSSLTSAKIGNSVTRIGNFAFDGCENLTSVSLGNSLETIGASAFNICTSLQSVTLPESVREIGAACFYGCSSLKNISMQAPLTEIPALSFAGCLQLTDLSFLPSTTKYIDDYAFYFCGGLREAVIPESVSDIGSHAFDSCEALEKVVISNRAARLDEFIFSQCHALKYAQLPADLDSIPQGTFLECTSLGEISLPEGITRIGDYAFGNCLSLPFITYPQSLEHIGNLAFYGCRRLRRLEFGPNLKSIGVEAFYDLPDLREIHCRPIDPISISFFTFDARADENASVYVPAVSADLYLTNMGWANFKHFYPETAYNPPSRLTIFFGDGGSVSRTVGYGTSMTLRLADTDGQLPARVEYDGVDMTASMNSEGVFVTPPITEPATLRVFSR